MEWILPGHRRNMRRRSGIVRTLSSNYRDVYLLNLREKTLSIIKEEEGNEDGLKKKEDGSYSYRKFLAKYIKERVHPDDRDMLA